MHIVNDVGAEGTSLRPADDAARTIPSQRLPATTDPSKQAVLERRRRLRAAGYEIEQVSGSGTEIDPERLAGSIEGFIGFSRVPLGVAGPVRIAGSAASGEFFVPFATSEGTLVASFQHAFNAMNRSGGASALCSDQQVGRAPCFEFASLSQAGAFARWLPSQLATLQEVTAGTSRHCRLLAANAAIVGNTVYVLFEFSTGDAAGQNMVTLSTQAICARLLCDMPTPPRSWLVESMMSGDKRATPMAFRSARGRNVSAEIVLPARQVERYWRTDASKMERAALTRVERTSANEVYASVTLPNLIVGTVGGGTYLPTAHECLAMLGCAGAGHARKFAEIVATVALAGELAIVGAMASGQFAAAHAAGGRKGLTAGAKVGNEASDTAEQQRPINGAVKGNGSHEP
jgi:hydroxymethylglutaryl-CoA reductase (NADPH)